MLVAGAAAAAAATGFDGAGADARAEGPPLEAGEVEELIARCVHFAKRAQGRPELTIAVADTEGNALGVFHMSGVPGPATSTAEFLDPNSRERRAARALAKAGTASYFSSDQQTFSTRTAAFIIQDHFPPGVRFMPAGPLYGVEFSSFAGTDVNPITLPAPAAGFESRVRGDLGAFGLYKSRRRVGGLGIDDGDEDKQISIPDRTLFGGKCADDYRLTHGNLERGRVLEKIAISAAGPYLAPNGIRARQIAVGGIRLPYTKVGPGRAGDVADLVVDEGEGGGAKDATGPDGAYDDAYPLRGAADIPSRFAEATLDPPAGAGAGQKSYRGEMPVGFPVRAGTDGILSEDDVRRLLWQGARRADITRGAIRRPIGLGMQCWISVVDTRGEVLGVFRFKEDATMFSYDVSVQKARTALFFSDDQVAWSSRGLGVFAQAFYPAGQQSKFTGPLFQLQDGITVGLLTGGIPATTDEGAFPLRNGITVFPGGVPLYRDGQLAGAVGVSGDGVDQDDIVASFAAEGYGAPGSIRCDAVDNGALKRSLRRALDRLEAIVPADPGTCSLESGVDQVGLSFFHARLRDCKKRVESVPFVLGTAYVKFPRHPGPVTIR